MKSLTWYQVQLVRSHFPKAEEMIEEGKELAAIAPNITVKIPMTTDGLKAVKALTDLGIKTNVTLILVQTRHFLQLELVRRMSPFLGRLDDIGQNGLDLISEVKPFLMFMD